MWIARASKIPVGLDGVGRQGVHQQLAQRSRGTSRASEYRSPSSCGSERAPAAFPRISSFSRNFCWKPRILRSLGQGSGEIHDPVDPETAAAPPASAPCSCGRSCREYRRAGSSSDPPADSGPRRRCLASPRRSTSARSPLPLTPGRICFRCSLENVPFQKKCASSGCRQLPSIQRFSLYSRPIFSSETGRYRSSAPTHQPPHPAGHQRNGRARRSAR